MKIVRSLHSISLKMLDIVRSINTRSILRSGSKAQDEGDSGNRGW